MFIDTPSNTLKLVNREDELTDDGMHYLLKWRRDSSMFYLENRNASPTKSQYQGAANHLSELTALAITAEHAEQLLSLYPQVRIKLAQYDGIEDTDVRDGLAFVAAHFFLGCQWPTIGDKVDLVAFLSLLQKQALAMGFKRCARKIG